MLYSSAFVLCLFLSIVSGNLNTSTIQTANYNSLLLRDLNATSTLFTLLETTHGGTGDSDDLITLMSLSSSPDLALLTALYRFTTYSPHLPIFNITSIATLSRPDLSRGILRAAFQARVNSLTNSTLGVLSSLYSESDKVTIIQDALNLAPTDLFHSLSQTISFWFPELRGSLLEEIERFAMEKKMQVVEVGGGILIGTEGGLVIKVAKGAMKTATRVEVHTYSCKLVSDYSEEGVECFGVAPHEFNKLVTVEFTVPDDGKSRQCFKASDALGEDWVKVSCYFTAGKASYSSTTFSIITARQAFRAINNSPRPVGTTLVEAPFGSSPPGLTPPIRFNKFHARSRSGPTYTGALPDTQLSGSKSGLDVGMSGVSYNGENGVLYWSNGFNIEGVVVDGVEWQAPFTQVHKLVEGGVRVDVRGEYLGIDRDDLIGVRVGENVACKVLAYISSTRLSCLVEYASGLMPYEINNVIVSTHRRANNAIPRVDYITINPKGHRPNAVHYISETNTLLWSDTGTRSVYAVDLTVQGLALKSSIVVLLSSVHVVGLFHQGEWLYVLQQGVLGRVRYDHGLKDDGMMEVVAQGFRHPMGLAIQGEHAYIALKYGSVLRVELFGQFAKEIVVRRETKSRLTGLVVVQEEGETWVYFGDSESSEIWRVGLVSKLEEIVARDALWPRGLVYAKQRVFWTEYLGQVWGVEVNSEVGSKGLVHSELGMNAPLDKDLLNVKTNYLKLVTN